MRICVFIASRASGRGGMEVAISSVLSGLERRGHQTQVVLLRESDDPAWHRDFQCVAGDFPLETYALAKIAPSVLFWVNRAISRFGPDAVLATEPRSAAIARAALPFGRHALLSWIHNGVSVSNKSWMFRLCNAHLIVSSQMAEDLPHRSHAFVVGNPVDCRAKAVPRPMTGAKFIYVGRLSGEKHIERILCSFAQTPPCATLQIIGDGPERDSLHRLAESLGLSGRVEWTGWVKDAWAEVQEASALVLTSSSEGLPLVLLEAAARGVPLIAMDCDYGPREIVNPENGWLLPLGDAAALAVLLQRIVNGEAALPPAEAVMETARPFGVEVVTDRIEDAIRRTVERRSRPMPQEQVGLDD